MTSTILYIYIYIYFVYFVYVGTYVFIYYSVYYSFAKLHGPVAYCKYTGLNLFSHTPNPYKISLDNQALCASNQLLCFFYRWVDCVLVRKATVCYHALKSMQT